jgi:long-chain-fatty-acid--CoA ligase ACSBG
MIGCLGAMFAGGKASGVYPSDTAEQFQYKAHHSRSSVVLVESPEHLKMVGKVIKDLPYLKAVAIWGGEPKEEMVGHAKVFSWNEFLARSERVSDEQLDHRLNLIKPGHSCSLIYTSGTSKCFSTVFKPRIQN